jgi:hypothetical protein
LTRACSLNQEDAARLSPVTVGEPEQRHLRTLPHQTAFAMALRRSRRGPQCSALPRSGARCSGLRHGYSKNRPGGACPG